MSKFIEDALERLKSSEFIVDDPNNPKTLEIRNAVLIYTNFAGRANNFGNESKNFNLIITPEIKDQIERGCFNNLKVKIHETNKRNPDDPVLYFINIKVNMLVAYPPIVTLCTDYKGQKSRTPLTDATIGCLDRINMARCDVIVNIKEAKARPGWAVFYLRKFNCIQYKNPEFGGAYEDWDDPLQEPNPEIAEQNADIINND